SSVAPAPVFVTFFTGHPKLMSTRSAPAASTIRAASAITAGSEPKIWIASGCSSVATRRYPSVRSFRCSIPAQLTISEQTSPAPNEGILTHEGYEKLKQEIEYLSTEKRREVADRLRIAREFGDIAENAEYDDAKNDQALLEHRIATLEERLLAARVIEAGEVTSDVVSI